MRGFRLSACCTCKFLVAGALSQDGRKAAWILALRNKFWKPTRKVTLKTCLIAGHCLKPAWHERPGHASKSAGTAGTRERLSLNHCCQTLFLFPQLLEVCSRSTPGREQPNGVKAEYFSLMDRHSLRDKPCPHAAASSDALGLTAGSNGPAANAELSRRSELSSAKWVSSWPSRRPRQLPRSRLECARAARAQCGRESPPASTDQTAAPRS